MNKKEQRNIKKNKSMWRNITKVIGINKKDYPLTKELFHENTIFYFDQTRPDIIVKNSQLNIVFGIEHFEFNNSGQNINRGSKYSQKSNLLSKTHRNLEQSHLENLAEDEIIMTTDSFNIQSSSNNLYDNFKSSFSKHYSKIESYEKKIEKCGDKYTKYKMGFIVEDTSPLGSISLPNFNIIPAYRVLEIMELVTKSNKIDFVIFVSSNSKEPVIFWRENLNESLKNLELFSIEELEFADPEVWEIRSTIKIK